MTRKIGVLALQGDFAKPEAMLQLLKNETVLVKKPGELRGCEGLIIPGGESTTLTKLIQKCNLYELIREFAEKHPVMGTCAGSIMLASTVDDHRIEPLRLIDISVARNAYGRQIDSFITQVDVPFLQGSKRFKAVFIRAPQIKHVGSRVEVLMELHGSPIMVQEGNVLAMTFHPELTSDPLIHKYFVEHFFSTQALL
jgi:5'-phosphate synthase pdxT subunit